MKKAIILALEDEDLIELIRILMDKRRWQLNGTINEVGACTNGY